MYWRNCRYNSLIQFISLSVATCSEIVYWSPILYQSEILYSEVECLNGIILQTFYPAPCVGLNDIKREKNSSCLHWILDIFVNTKLFPFSSFPHFLSLPCWSPIARVLGRWRVDSNTRVVQKRHNFELDILAVGCQSLLSCK